MARTITVKRETKDEDDLLIVKINGRFMLSIREKSEIKLWKKIEKAIREIK